MKTELLNFDTITEYDDMLGVETLHPLVSVINLSKAKPMRHMRHTFGFYVVFLKDEKNCDLIYGRQRYDGPRRKQGCTGSCHHRAKWASLWPAWTTTPILPRIRASRWTSTTRQAAPS